MDFPLWFNRGGNSSGPQPCQVIKTKEQAEEFFDPQKEEEADNRASFHDELAKWSPPIIVSDLVYSWNGDKFTKFKQVLEKSLRQLHPIKSIQIFPEISKKTNKDVIHIIAYSSLNDKKIDCEIILDDVMKDNCNKNFPFQLSKMIADKLTIRKGRPMEKLPEV